jgi:aryl-alcohol dehydrogenase-like predicted oxidoreductase
VPVRRYRRNSLESAGARPFGQTLEGRGDWPDQERHYGNNLYRVSEDADRVVVDRLAEVASARGIPMAHVALAWILGRGAVTAPIVGATKPVHLEDAVAALSVRLTDDEVRRLEEPYIPHQIAH